MARIARVVIAGRPHHIAQWGDREEDVFHSDRERQRYLDLLKEHADEYGLDILAYCLMRNHVHLVAVPREADSLALALKRVHLRYSQYINQIHGWVGRLWQGRFQSCVLDREYSWVAVKHVERNPVGAWVVGKPELYPWRSAAGHAGGRRDPVLSRQLEKQSRVSDWSKWLRQRDSSEEVERLRQHTRTGRPLGSAAFMSRLEKKLGRVLRARPRGRPSKA